MVTTLKKAKLKAISDLISWIPGSEADLYPYFRDFFHVVLKYPKKAIRINEVMRTGIPDISLFAREVEKISLPWIVCEVKPEPGFFRLEKNQRSVWKNQLSRYITADVVYALLLDPVTIVILNPDGQPIGNPIFVEKIELDDLSDYRCRDYIGFLSYDDSLSRKALLGFIKGQFPSKYIDVTTRGGRDLFRQALRISAAELRNYAARRIKNHFKMYEEYSEQIAAINKQVSPDTSDSTVQKQDLLNRYEDARHLMENVLPTFQVQIGREIPKEGKKAQKFIMDVYAAEAANLVLARILFVKFFEDYDMVTRKISNGGIHAFRNFYTNVKDDYRFLLDSAFRDSKFLYPRLFERSVFDWAHTGNRQLSNILLRIFFRLNSFDFAKITGDMLGNLYEHFLDQQSRKKLGEFYTPSWVVDYILEAIGFKDEPGELLDPACGSGTFLFRAIEMAIDTFVNRGVSQNDAIRLAVDLINGIDVNIFAAFIAQLQVIWHLFPYLKKAELSEIPDLKIYGGVDSLEGHVQKRLDESSISLRENRAIKIRDRNYRYVVGNPPYIRAERVKAPGRWEVYYPEVAKGKKDVAFYFIHRALKGGKEGIKPWLEPNGKIGFIVSYGIADSKAAKPLREIILNNKLKEIVDLESLSNEVFTSGIATSRGTVAPIIIIAERSQLQKDYSVKITVGTHNCIVDSEPNLQSCTSSIVSSSLFRNDVLNPWHRYLSKISQSDLPILKKLVGKHDKLSDYAAQTRFARALSVGIQTGRGKGKIFEKSGKRRFPMARGLHIHTFYLNTDEITEYVSLEKVDSKSVWRYPSLLKRPAYAVNEIGYAPQAALFDPSEVIAQKSCIVFIPRDDARDFPWDSFVNSKVVRYLFGLLLRSALIEGNEMIWRSTINVQDLGFLPVPRRLQEKQEELLNLTMRLRDLARDIHRYWVKLDNQIETSSKAPLASLPVKYHNVEDPRVFTRFQLKILKGEENHVLQPFQHYRELPSRIEADRDLLVVLKYLVENPRFNVTPSARLRVPKDYGHFSQAIRQGDTQENPKIGEFKSLLANVDQIIEEGFAISEEEKSYIHRRLSTSPFELMQPRWPWTRVSIRPVRIYSEDRFLT